MLLIPKFTSVNDHAFLADDTLIGCYELGGGWIRVEHVKIGKRAFVGNSGMAAAGPQGAQGVAGRRPLGGARAAPWPRPGRRWLGSPPTKLRRTAGETDDSRTYDPPTRLQVYARPGRDRAGWSRCCSACCSHVAVGVTLLALLRPAARWLAVLLAGPVLHRRRPRRGPRHRRGQVAARRPAPHRGAPALVVGSSGATSWPTPSPRCSPPRGSRSGHPGHRRAQRLAADARRADRPRRLVRHLLAARDRPGRRCDDGATVNHGCVVQTHLFHDRVLDAWTA